MERNQRFSKWLPHFMMIGIIILVAVVYNLPALQGNYLMQHDIFTWLQASKEHRDFVAKTGEVSGWANNMFSGMPQVLIDHKSDGNWFAKIINTVLLYTHGLPHNPIMLFVLAMLSFYLMSCSLKWNNWLGLIGAIAFAFASYNPVIIVAGHTTKFLDVAYIPALVAAAVYAYQGRYWLGGALAGVVMAFMVEAGHYQIIYYSAVMMIVLVIGIAIQMAKKGNITKWIKASAFLVIGLMLGVMVNNSRFLITQEYTKYSIRGGNSELASSDEKTKGLNKEYAFGWSNGVGENLCVLVPNLYGGSNSEALPENSNYAELLRTKFRLPSSQVENMNAHAPTYWGPQPMLSGPMYFGAIICFLFVLSLFVVKNPLKWWGLGIAAFFFILSTGKNLGINDFLFEYFPLLNKFRAPSMALVIPSFLFVTMGIWALKETLYGTTDKAELLKKVKYTLYITGGLTLLVLIYTQVGMTFKGAGDEALASQFGEAGDEVMSAIRSDRASMAMKDSLRSLILILLTGGLILAFIKDKINATITSIALLVLVAFDNLGVAKRYLNNDKYVTESKWQKELAPRAVDKQIMQDKSLNYRVLDITKSTYNDAFPSLFHQSIGGYHGAKLQIYQDLIEKQLSKYNSSVLNMLNTKYIIVPGNQQNPQMVQTNPGALGNAWFVQNIKTVASAEEEMNSLNGPSLQNLADSSMGNFNPAVTAVVRQDHWNGGTPQIAASEGSTITLKSAVSNRLEYETNNTQNGFAVFSEIYYPKGWTATIDGKPADIIRTNYVLRGLQIPAGQHKVVFEFKYPHIDTYETIAMVGSILLLLFVGLAVYFESKKSKEKVA